MDQVETLKCSDYPSLKEMIEKVRENEPLTVPMPVTGKAFDNALIRRCQRTIDTGIYLVVLEDMTMFYVEDDI